MCYLAAQGGVGGDTIGGCHTTRQMSAQCHRLGLVEIVTTVVVEADSLLSCTPLHDALARSLLT
jgi:hypothetical protein